jgi:hypothetical protein
MGFLSRLLGKERSAPQPRIVAHVAFDGAVRVFETPIGDGWSATEDQREGDGFVVMVLKYLRSSPPMPFALLAKIYTADANQTPPEDPRNTNWRVAFKGLFSSFSSVEVRESQQLTMKSSLPGTEAVIDGIGADPPEPLRVRERRSVLGREQFIVTAFGSPSAFETFAADGNRWFDTSAFVPLGDKSPE